MDNGKKFCKEEIYIITALLKREFNIICGTKIIIYNNCIAAKVMYEKDKKLDISNLNVVYFLRNIDENTIWIRIEP